MPEGSGSSAVKACGAAMPGFLILQRENRRLGGNMAALHTTQSTSCLTLMRSILDRNCSSLPYLPSLSPLFFHLIQHPTLLVTTSWQFLFAILIITSPAAWQPSLGQQQHHGPNSRGAPWVEAHRDPAVRAEEWTNLRDSL